MVHLNFDVEEPTQKQEGSAMRSLLSMAKEAIDLESLVADLENNLSDVKLKLHKLRTIKLPNLMAENGINDFTTDTGFKITIDVFVSGSLPKDEYKRGEALHWLETHDASSLIKTELELQFSKSQHNEALSILSELNERGYEPTCKMGVHPMTLISHIKERLKKGDEVPLELLGLYVGHTARIKQQKGK